MCVSNSAIMHFTNILMHRACRLLMSPNLAKILNLLDMKKYFLIKISYANEKYESAHKVYNSLTTTATAFGLLHYFQPFPPRTTPLSMCHYNTKSLHTNGSNTGFFLLLLFTKKWPFIWGVLVFFFVFVVIC